MPDVVFDLATGFDRGLDTSVAIHPDGLVLEVHRSQLKNDPRTFYNFGRLDVGHIAFQFGAQQYGTGNLPHVAFHYGGIVEVHEAVDAKGNLTSRLEYRTAIVENNKLRFVFGPSDYGFGRHPAVAMNRDGVTIGFDQDGDGNLGYRIGTFANDGSLSNWNQRQEFPGRGIFPAVAIDGAGFVVVAYQDTNTIQTYTWVGRLRPGSSTVQWAKERAPFGTNLHPSVALTEDGLVILSVVADASLVVANQTGVLDRDNLALQVDNTIRKPSITTTYDLKNQGRVSVATNGNVAVQTFSNGRFDIGYASSLVRDHVRWMSSQLPRFGKKSLGTFVVPGSHDAGTYVVRDCTFLGGECNSKTQDLTYYQQLFSGVRYFDVRPVLYNNQLETGHFGDVSGILNVIEVLVPIVAILRAAGKFPSNQGCNGPSLAEVLSDVRKYMDIGSGELVILKFSHYLDRDKDKGQFDSATMKRLTDAVVDALRPFLYVHQQGSDPFTNRLSGVTLETILQGGGKVLPLFDLEGSPGGALPEGLYRYRDLKRDSNPPILTRSSSEQERRSVFASTDFLVYDNFANTNDLSALQTDQFQKLQNGDNHIAEMFLFSWTLTQDTRQSVLCPNIVTTDILTLAAIADTALAENVTRAFMNRQILDDRLTNIIYGDRVARFFTDVVIWLNERRTLGNALQSTRRDYLGPGDQIISNNGIFMLRYDAGDLFVAQTPTTPARSVSHTTGQPAWRCIMREDGNLVVYSEPYTPVFQSNTAGHPGAKVEIGDDGAVRIIGPDSTVIKTL